MGCSYLKLLLSLFLGLIVIFFKLSFLFKTQAQMKGEDNRLFSKCVMFKCASPMVAINIMRRVTNTFV